MAAEAIRPGELQVHTLSEGGVGTTGNLEVIRLPLEIVEGEDFLLTVEFGKIVETQAPAVFVPSDRFFSLPLVGPKAWGVERAILEAAGPELFITARERIERARNGEEPLGMPGFFGEVPFSGSEVFTSDKLGKEMIFTNVWGGDWVKAPEKCVAQVLTGALGVADREGIESVAVPDAILGIRHVNINNVFMGMLLGIDNTVQQNWYRGNVKSIALVMDVDPVQDNVDAVAERLQAAVDRFTQTVGTVR